MQLLYNTNVRFFILAAGRREYGNELADPFGRALAYLAADWKKLLKRMRKQGIPPKHAACVAAAYIWKKAPVDRLGYPIDRAMKTVHDIILIEILENEGFRKYCDVTRVLSDEGLPVDDE